MSLFLNKTHHTEQRQRAAQVGVNRGALPCIRLACATSGYCMTNEPHLSPNIQRQRGLQAYGKSLRRLNQNT